MKSNDGINYAKRYVILVWLFIITFVMALHIGAVPLDWQQILSVISYPIFHHVNFSSQQYAVVWFLRLPRLLAIALVGFGLGLAGSVMQGLLRNPLADPGLLGVSAGASLAIILFWLMGGPAIQLWLWQWLTPYVAVLGTFGVLVFLYFSAEWTGQNTVAGLILIGLACNALFSAVIALVLYLSPHDFLQNAVLWSFGGVTTMPWLLLASGSILMLLGLVLLLNQAFALNVLALGEEDAAQLGVGLMGFKVRTIVGVSLIVAASVAFAGPVSFVGLMVPHIMRRIYGPAHQHLLVCSGLGGAVLLLLADMLCQSISRVGALPLGVVTALMGALFFLWLLFYYRAHDYYA